MTKSFIKNRKRGCSPRVETQTARKEAGGRGKPAALPSGSVVLKRCPRHGRRMQKDCLACRAVAVQRFIGVGAEPAGSGGEA